MLVEVDDDREKEKALRLVDERPDSRERAETERCRLISSDAFFVCEGAREGMIGAGAVLTALFRGWPGAVK